MGKNDGKKLKQKKNEERRTNIKKLHEDNKNKRVNL